MPLSLGRGGAVMPRNSEMFTRDAGIIRLESPILYESPPVHM